VSRATSGRDDDDDDYESEFGSEDTIGKSAAARLANSRILGGGGRRGDYKEPSESPSPLSNRRLRTQSAYGFSSIAASSSPNILSNMYNSTSTAMTTGVPSVAPLKPKMRSKSTERLNPSNKTGDGMANTSLLTGASGGKFVDPLVLRRQSKDSLMSKPIAMPKPVGKIPIGQLVAFFDGDKK